MSILVVGSVGLDTVKTPFGKVSEVLGGSGTYFSIAASYFAQIKLVAVVGSDFPEKHVKMFARHNVDTSGLQKTKGKTFRWKGEYSYDLNNAKTLDTKLNVFASFKPKIPAAYRTSDYVFLGNMDPDLQMDVLSQVKRPKLVAADTMNFWIESKKEALKKVIRKVDILLINESEARQLAGEYSLVKAVRIIKSFGPQSIVIKRGEYGSLFFNAKEVFSAPAYPLEKIFDPTGAGDTFAGGFMGYLSTCNVITDSNLRRAIVFGSVMASFNVEDFSLGSLSTLTPSEIKQRFNQFKKLTHFDVLV